jgi:iron-sulfur cluster assembly protein
MFTLTGAAARQIQQAAHASAAQHLALRIAAKVDADGSIQYGMGFDDPREMDLKLDLNGVAIVIGAEHQELLHNTTLDFVELQPGQVNFIFVDENLSRPASAGHCGGGGCGNCDSTTGSSH